MGDSLGLVERSDDQESSLRDENVRNMILDESKNTVSIPEN